eukprot:TRINITY_DN98786_c0_g1_i1.p1 TRINITY_DN98786_c0_g1~~TRINITY_DN98786_c0_g1_i1.p1  ORF type:complete len:170 (-),score=31.07 TRINITY_DN98786_c0_g1_i1:64-522(-)
MFSGAVAYLAAAAETIDVICPPQQYNKTFIKIIADVVTRRLDESNETLITDSGVPAHKASGRTLRASGPAVQPSHPLDTLPSVGPWGEAFREHRELFDQKKFYSGLKDSKAGKHLLNVHQELQSEMADNRGLDAADHVEEEKEKKRSYSDGG